MTRFYIDTDNGHTRQRDTVGIDLPNANAARDIALETLPDLTLSTLRDDHDHSVVKAVVRDQDGKPVYRAMMTRSGTSQ